MSEIQSETKRAKAIKAKYEKDLLKRKDVQGVGVGLRQKAGEFTQEVCIVVMVRIKMAFDDLEDDERLPVELEGVGVDVQEVGDITVG